MDNKPKQTNYGALTTITLVFFFWGFIAAGNSVFIPFCKDYFSLDQFQSQLIDFAFYGAYYLGALGLFVYGSSTGKDLVGGWGYKKSIVFGLLFSALGAVAMIISVEFNVFSGMLLGLFIVALGFSLQQTGANPFMISLGDESTGSNRINLGGGINSLGTTIGPLVIAFALFGSGTFTQEEIANLDLWKVIVLYALVGGLFIGIAALIGFSKKVPAGIVEGKPERARKAVVTLLLITGLLIGCFAPVFASYASKDAKAIETNQTSISDIQDDITEKLEAANYEVGEMEEEELETLSAEVCPTETAEISALETTNEDLLKPLEQTRMYWLLGALAVIVLGMLIINRVANKQKEGWGAMQYPQLTFGMLAIFTYVGVEVAVGSNLAELLKQPKFGGLGTSEIAPYVAMFWGSLMIGRWGGAINAFEMKKQTKQILRFVVPLVAFGVVLLASAIAGHDVKPFYWYIFCVLLQIVVTYITNDRPAITLGIFGTLAFVAMIIGLTSSGMVTIYAFLSAGLFCSIMWPSIFSLSLIGLGKFQTQGSAFLVMMILGGGIIPPIQGKLSDIIGIQESFFVGALCFAYLAAFAFIVKRTLKKQGLATE
ncbi:MAG: MFS transporter [Crocinitomicaceae bacterium]|nr:MFS transporter [Crocinitomicaceae bacterium]